MDATMAEPLQSEGLTFDRTIRWFAQQLNFRNGFQGIRPLDGL
jgi:hypothetical protein